MRLERFEDIEAWQLAPKPDGQGLWPDKEGQRNKGNPEPLNSEPVDASSSRQGCNLAGESPAVFPMNRDSCRTRSDATVREGNLTSIAWCKRPGCSVATVLQR